MITEENQLRVGALATALFVCIVFCVTSTSAQNATIAGEVTTPFPTIIHLAIKWKMQKGMYEMHGVCVDMSIFKDVPFPERPVPELNPQDLRPIPGSAVVDAGVVLPNINDDFLGHGPDIGAYEVGSEMPVYGPRAAGVDEETQYKHHAGNSRGKHE